MRGWGVAHDTRSFEDPADTFRVLAKMSGSVRLLPQVLDQVSRAYADHRERAFTDDGLAAELVALLAADELPQADDVLDLVDREGAQAAIAFLSQWDFGEETTNAALVNEDVYDQFPAGGLDQVAEHGGYTLTLTSAMGYTGAVPLPVLPREQDCILAELDTTNRRLCNQAFFTKIYTDEEDQLRVENNANALTWAQDDNKIRTKIINNGKGPSLVRRVDLRREFANFGTTARTVCSRWPRGGYRTSKRPPKPCVVDSRGQSVRSLDGHKALFSDLKKAGVQRIMP